MGHRVANLYGVTADKDTMTLEIVSAGIYTIEIIFDTIYYDYLKKYNWCYEQTKGQVYCMDLTYDLPKTLGYKTPRVYLRNYLTHLSKNNKINWKHRSLENYKIDNRAALTK